MSHHKDENFGSKLTKSDSNSKYLGYEYFE